ncbi:RING-H2 finger protein ATL80 [Rhynchospora pubera]|uniref:RING-H2 finger protein ATL80 n=1 Tax=Rhynchospora pubera TaxID=906938 RepID=A0AAV8DBD5_9POAL|nr:RING-H2 finger protein ATL80 [Rhynchospora pubera]
MAIYISVVLLAIAVALILTLHILLIRWAMTRGQGWFSEPVIGEVLMPGTRETTTGLSPGDVAKLPSYTYTNRGEEETASGTAACAVCIENFCFGDRCRLLPQCKHSFHADCVDSWLMKCALCPICRGAVAIIMKDEMFPDRQEVVVGISESSSSYPL